MSRKLILRAATAAVVVAPAAHDFFIRSHCHRQPRWQRGRRAADCGASNLSDLGNRREAVGERRLTITMRLLRVYRWRTIA